MTSRSEFEKGAGGGYPGVAWVTRQRCESGEHARQQRLDRAHGRLPMCCDLDVAVAERDQVEHFVLGRSQGAHRRGAGASRDRSAAGAIGALSERAAQHRVYSFAEVAQSSVGRRRDVMDLWKCRDARTRAQRVENPYRKGTDFRGYRGKYPVVSWIPDNHHAIRIVGLDGLGQTRHRYPRDFDTPSADCLRHYIGPQLGTADDVHGPCLRRGQHASRLPFLEQIRCLVLEDDGRQYAPIQNARD